MNGAAGFLAGSIVAKLLLDTKGWKQSLGDIKKDELAIKNAAAKIGSAIGLGIKVAAGAATAAVGTLGLLVKKVADSGNAFNDMSKRVGISVEILSGYDLMAKKTGTSLEGMAVGFRGLSSRMLDASRGLEAQKKTFDELGIKVVGADGKLRAMDEVLLEVADRFSKMKDGTEKAALAQDLFGRSGMELIPMLNEGRRAMEENLVTARRLGLVWSKEDAAAADALNDSIAELSGGFRGIINDVGKVLIPVFQTLVDAAGQGLARIREHVAKLAKDGTLREWAIGLGKTFILVFKGMAKAVEGLLLTWGVFKATVFAGAAEIARRLAMMMGQFMLVMDAVSKVVPGLKGITKDIAGIIKDIAVVGQSFGETADLSIEKTTDIAVSFEVLFEELNKLSASLANPPKQVQTFHETVEKFVPRDIELFNQLGGAIKGAVDPFETYRNLLGEGWGKPLVMGEPEWKNWTSEQWEADIRSSFEYIEAKSKETKGKVGEDVKDIGHYFDGLYNDIATGFANAMQGLFEGTASFADFFKSIWNSIKAAFFRILGEMVAGFVVKFVKQIVGGMGLVQSLTSAIGIGKTVASAAAAAGTAATSAAATATAASGVALTAAQALSGFVAVGTLWLGGLLNLINKNFEVPTLPMIPSMAIYGPGGYTGGTDMPTWSGKYRHTQALGTSTSTTSGKPSAGINISISTLDGADVVRVVRQKVIPILREAARRNEFWIPLGSAGGV